MGWTMREVIELLRREGIRVTTNRIRYAMLVGRVTRPPVDGAGNYHFQAGQLNQMRAVFSQPVRAGRRARPLSEVSL